MNHLCICDNLHLIQLIDEENPDGHLGCFPEVKVGKSRKIFLYKKGFAHGVLCLMD
jgi:hypothetical protein